MGVWLLSAALALSSVTAWACDKVVLSGDHDRPPFSWREEARIVGAGTDIAEIIFERLGVEVESRFVGPWQRVLANAEQGRIDFINSLYINPQRRHYLAFVEPAYFQTANAIYVHRGQHLNYDGWRDLIGKRGAKTRGYSFGRRFDAFANEHLQLAETSRIVYNLERLKRGWVEYYVGERYSTDLVIQKHGLGDAIRVLEESVFHVGKHMAFVRSSDCVRYLDDYRRELRRLIERGRIRAIIERNLRRWRGRHLEPSAASE